MRIGLTGGGSTIERIVEQAVQAEADGFASMWLPGAVAGDALLPISHAGKATTSIELGTAVLPTYLCHPVLQANRAEAVVASMGRPGLVLGVGPSHQPVVEGSLGLSYDHPGRHTEEYVTILTSLLAGETVDFRGEDHQVRAQPSGMAQPITGGEPIPVLVAALGSRLLRVAGERAAGTILWMANARAVESHVAARITRAAKSAGRPAPRIVAGLPVAVHDDIDEARQVAASQFEVYGQLPNYQRILEHGEVAGPAEAAIIGDEAAVEAQIRQLFAAGATDVWAAPFPVGGDRKASRQRTHDLLVGLAAAS
ncbi:MAG TPA: TIGR03564 family F420-dependent LLM class oxidoreductase [Acidimicrobiales bacterium]|nr:TIGR03564 family F420-dependent LLM class oxidoreductase [Acidimicrobiales bacterium]